ncbi:MAG: hypothetical protein WKG07_32780 [Hymenobacter sp.]
MFMDLLTGQAPVVLFHIRRVLYWGSADQPFDFTTIADTASYTALAALDPTTPRYLRIAGQTATVRQLQAEAGAATSRRFGRLRAGGLWLLRLLIHLTRKLGARPWGGVSHLAGDAVSAQYVHRTTRLTPLDNGRYPELEWAPVRAVLAGKAAG